MKRILLAILTIISTFQITFSQKLKYDDIFNLIINNEKARAFSLLFEYQKTNPEFPNTYFQLGNLSYDWALKSDPFKELAQTDYYISNTKLFYGLAISKLIVQDKDVQRNEKLYMNIDEFKDNKKLKNDIVTDFINVRLSIINRYDSSMHNSVNLLNKTVLSYQKTVSLFSEIIFNYQNINDLYLIQKDSILKSTNNLIIYYDSTIFYFNKFKESLKKDPILDYNQKIYPQIIKTYRLQGFSKTNFLNDSIIIWDYKAWAISLQDELNSNINHFRETISKTNKALSDKEKEINEFNKNTNIFKPISLEQKIYFEIEKYDNNSLINKLFDYKISKINLLVIYKRIFNDTSNYSMLPEKRQMELYDLIIQKEKTDSVLNILQTNTNSKDYLKHKEFFDNNYNGFEKFQEYLKVQKYSNFSILNNSLSNALFFTYRDIFNFNNNQKNIKYNDSLLNINISLIEPTNANNNSYVTTSSSINDKGEKFITGYYKILSNSSAFIAKIKNDSLIWLKIFPTEIDNYDYGTNICTTYDGCFLIVHSINKTKSYNSLIKITNDGSQVSKKEIKNSKLVRYIHFDEVNNQILIAYQGKTLDYWQDKSDTLFVENIDLKNNSKSLWEKNIILNGNLINIIKIDTNYHIFANYHLISIDQTNIVNNNENIIHLVTDLKCNYIEANDIKSKFFIFGFYAYKINSNIISIVGTTKTTDFSKSGNFKELPSAYYILIDKNNKNIFENH